MSAQEQRVSRGIWLLSSTPTVSTWSRQVLWLLSRAPCGSVVFPMAPITHPSEPEPALGEEKPFFPQTSAVCKKRPGKDRAARAACETSSLWFTFLLHSLLRFYLVPLPEMCSALQKKHLQPLFRARSDVVCSNSRRAALNVFVLNLHITFKRVFFFLLLICLPTRQGAGEEEQESFRH